VPTIIFCSPYSKIDVPAGTSILDAAGKAGIPLESPCNQIDVCGKCRVRLSPDSAGSIKTPEDFVLHPAAAQNGWVLACHTLIYDDIEMSEIPVRVKKDAGSVLAHGLCHA